MDIHCTIYKQNKKSLLKTKVHIATISQSYLHCTFTLEALFDYTPQQTSTVVAEGGTHVVVGLETVRHVNFEALLLELQGQTRFIISMNDRWQKNPNQVYLRTCLIFSFFTFSSASLSELVLSEGNTLLDSSQVSFHCDLKCPSETTPHLSFTPWVGVCT